MFKIYIMAKYRLLSQNELDELVDEFIEFLVINGIPADNWKVMKEKHPKKVLRIIELFSDVVFDSIMRKTKFLELRDKKELKTYQCLEDRFVLVGLNALKIDDADFTEPQYMEMALSNQHDNLKIYTTEIKYEKSRGEDIFELMEKGFEKSDGKLFKTLCLAMVDS